MNNSECGTCKKKFKYNKNYVKHLNKHILDDNLKLNENNKNNENNENNENNKNNENNVNNVNNINNINNKNNVNDLNNNPKIKKSEDVRDQGLDKFYTISSYSKICIEKVFELYNKSDFDLIIEPSAGNGSFYNQIENDNKIGLDISPEDENILKMNFFDYTPPQNKKNILVIGNPPFGKISSIAIKFFNHSSKWANVIAFIIPRTFRRFSVQNKLNNNFHLIYDSDVPLNPCCFTPKLNVKCCFQIWHRQNNIRPVINLEKKHDDWDFLAFGPLDKQNQPTPPNNADFAILAYGGKIGKIEKNNLNNLRPKSWHWIKCNIEEKELINRFNKLDYSNGLNTARQNSIGRGELVKLYSDFINSKS